MLGQFHLTWHRKSIRMFLAKGLGDNSKSSTVYFLPLTFHEKVPKKSCLRGVPLLLVQARVTFTPWIVFLESSAFIVHRAVFIVRSFFFSCQI